MPFTKDQYSLKRTLSIRAAMARAIERALLEHQFDVHGRAGEFAAVYDSWPDYTARIVVPAAVVLPTPLRYVAARMTPALIRESWEPKDGEGKSLGLPGFGLYKTADVEGDFQVQIRTPTEGERDPYVAGMEDLWTASDTDPVDVSGFQPGSTEARYGVILDLPEYYNQCAGFWLLEQLPLDDADKVTREHRETIFTIRGVASQVRLGPVQPMKPIVKLEFQDPNC